MTMQDVETPNDQPVSFETVFKAEREQLSARRAQKNQRDKVDPIKENKLVGLALSGGGIRSASVCLGAIQALDASGRLQAFDYISTVSGGGYTGACLNVSMSAEGGRTFPFGADVSDSPVVAHLRNFSNYLLPRDRSAGRNWLEAAAIILRGWFANAVYVLAFMLPIVMALVIAFPDHDSLKDPNFLIRFVHGLFQVGQWRWNTPPVGHWHVAIPMLIPRTLGVLLASSLLLWATLKSLAQFDVVTNDSQGILLRITFTLLLLSIVFVTLDLQPLAILGLERASSTVQNAVSEKGTLSFLIALMTAVGGSAGRLGRYLQRSERSHGTRTRIGRILARLVLFVGALVLPVLLWLATAALYLWVLRGAPFSICAWQLHSSAFPIGGCGRLIVSTRFDLLAAASILLIVAMFCLKPNNYSLHWLYRDRLSQAFLVGPPGVGARCGRFNNGPDANVTPQDARKLTDLRNSIGPYPILNCALNVQGSLEANKRGRNADFFVFTPEYTGSALTGYVRTQTMEKLDPRLDLGGAVAISGAAASANMGSQTIRLLSPTLALLNVRLGYYLDNPRYIGEQRSLLLRLRTAWQKISDEFFLLIEMLNGLNEERRTIYLSDGGHIENLGIYELLRRHCSLIFAIDAEADPEFGCGSLLALERYARIDLGILIRLPWEKIAAESRETRRCIDHNIPHCNNGPHCAIGRIQYPDGEKGLLVYVKSSLSGDERDYILDYARRNPTFPHEATSDQFFSEEQFEMYRALGFHMVQGVFGSDGISFVEGLPWGFADEASARAEMNDLIPASS